MMIIMIYQENIVKLLMKYVKHTYISCTLRSLNKERFREGCRRKLYLVCTKKETEGTQLTGAQSRHSSLPKIYIFQSPSKQNTTNIIRYNRPQANSNHKKEEYY